MKKLLLAFILFSSSILLFAQGVTTASMNGRITDENGESLIGATVIVAHTPSGTEYGSISDLDGYFRIPNMRVGGPYTVTVAYVGFETYTKENLSMTLGQSFKLSVTLMESTQTLGEVIVTASSGLIDGNRTGAETKVSSREINSLPNASRGIQDFTRLTPQASVTGAGGISIAGTNNRYNSIFIDGATSNDVFGLADNGQNGGQVEGLTLISMDALDQISVAVAPYDVTLSGFAGGGISAVTRSGTNEYEGSAYYLVRNQNFAGKTPKFISDPADIEREKLDEFSSKTYGFRAGGPIIKNKLFFFMNGEIQQDETPVPFDFSTYTGDLTRNDVNSVVSTLNGLGYNPGSFENTIRKLEANRFLFKLDYNLSKQHKISLRHSYNSGESFSPGGSNSTSIRFENSGLSFASTTNSTTIEVSSNFEDKSNKLIVGFTNVKDDRDPLGNSFPYVDIRDGNIEFGSEQFSTANLLDQKIFTLTNNFNLYKGRHTLTFGTHNEYYDMNNVFIRQNFGYYAYDNVADFLSDVNGGSGLATTYQRSYSLVDDLTGDNTSAAAAFRALQVGFYIQDEFQVTDKLKLTGGLRVDIPMFLDDPEEDTYFNNTTASLIAAEGYDLKGALAGQAPDPQLLFSPRVGFNYDVKGDQSTQLRGGIGVFTSRIPYVWPGAMFNNNGLTLGGVDVDLADGAVIDFNPDAFGQPTISDFGGVDAVPQGQMDLFVSDFKFPQVLRASLAVDQKLPWGLIGTVEAIYTKNINAIFYENVNLATPTERFEGTPDNRFRFTNGRVDGTYSAIYLGSNTNEGYSYNFSASLTKPFENGFATSLAYNFGRAEAIFEGTSSQNSSQWRGVYAINGRNNAQLGRSDFDVASRILATVSYKKEYLNNFATTVSFFYNGQSGSPFSYTYNDGRFTGEDSRQRALIYVPASQSEIVFADAATADAQWAALNNFIENDDYLSERRGQYAEKNMGRLPFTSILDFRLLQDFYVELANGKRNTIQLSFDIFNFGNLVNGEWGKRYFTGDGDGTGLYLLNFEGFQGDTNIPTYSFDTSATEKEDFLGKDDSGLISSRWQMQFGVRYIFGN